MIEDLLELQVCDCGREWCQFFSPSEGEQGASYSLESVKAIRDKLPELQAHLDEILEQFKSKGGNL